MNMISQATQFQQLRKYSTRYKYYGFQGKTNRKQNNYA